MSLGNNISLHWESHRNNLSNGFSKLQQMQEFVDVTLAAGGHLVKAHQNVLALASPYLKELLQSSPCRHPILFLGPIDHTILCFILEYIYTGEVIIPKNILPSFVEASKMLHLVGIKDLQKPEALFDLHTTRPTNILSDNIDISSPIQFPISSRVDDKNMITVEEDENDAAIPSTMDQLNELAEPHFAACINIDDKNHGVSVQPLPYYDNSTGMNMEDYSNKLVEDDEYSTHSQDSDIRTDFEDLIPNTSIVPKITYVIPHTYNPTNDSESNTQTSIDKESFNVNVSTESGLLTIKKLPRNDENKEDSDFVGTKILGNMATVFYTKSTRGGIRMILNRFMFNLHHKAFDQRKRRWRCIDYRTKHCRAYVDTLDEKIVCRKEAHSHYFHDAKIFKLGKKYPLHTTIQTAMSGFETPEQD